MVFLGLPQLVAYRHETIVSCVSLRLPSSHDLSQRDALLILRKTQKPTGDKKLPDGAAKKGADSSGGKMAHPSTRAFA